MFTGSWNFGSGFVHSEQDAAQIASAAASIIVFFIFFFINIDRQT